MWQAYFIKAQVINLKNIMMLEDNSSGMENISAVKGSWHAQCGW